MTIRKPEKYPIPATLREALYNLIHKSSIPAKAQAEELGLSLSYLYNSCNSELEGFEYQLRLLAPHTRLTENYSAIDFIEKALGRVAIEIPDCGCKGHNPETLAAGLMLIAKEMGEAADCVCRSLEDGILGKIEIERCKKETWDLIVQAMKLYKKLESME